jgi:hypothetical protein
VPHHNDSIRLIVVCGGLLAITIPMQIRFERRRQAAGIVRPLPIRSPRIIGAKLALVLLAFGAEWLLGKVTPSADLIVAVGVFATVALLAPKAHRYLAGQRRRAPVNPSQAAEPLPPATDLNRQRSKGEDTAQGPLAVVSAGQGPAGPTV